MIARVAIGLVVLGAALLLAYLWRRREGRFTEASGRFDRTELGIAWREKPSAVLVEFYGEDCAPCTVVQQRIEKLSAQLPDVSIVQIDAAAKMRLAERYQVRRVPTLFVADSDLKIIWRASGVPSEDAIRKALLGPDWAGRPHPADEPAAAERR